MKESGADTGSEGDRPSEGEPCFTSGATDVLVLISIPISDEYNWVHWLTLLSAG